MSESVAKLFQTMNIQGEEKRNGKKEKNNKNKKDTGEKIKNSEHKRY